MLESKKFKKIKKVSASGRGWKANTWQDKLDYRNEIYNIYNEKPWDNGHAFYLAVIRRFGGRRMFDGIRWANRNQDYVESLVK